MMIGELAKKSGVGIETIRYYEKEGLIIPVGRKRSGYRFYDEKSFLRLGFIKRTKELGFSLRETKTLLDLASKNASCASIKKQTEEKISDIEQRISDLHRIKTALQSLAESCDSNAPTSECPILENFFEGSHRS